MFIILLKFGANRGEAKQFMDGHNAWLKQGFDDGVFLLAGTIKPSEGGAIIAQGIGLVDLQLKIQQDPFVAESVVTPEIIEISPSRVDGRLAFIGNL